MLTGVKMRPAKMEQAIKPPMVVMPADTNSAPKATIKI